MPERRGLLHEGAHHVVRVVGVAHRVRRAEQHLQQQVGHGRAEPFEPRPRILAQEAHGDVERGAAPAFHGEQLRHHVRVVRRDGSHVRLPHARGEQRLVRVAHGRVGDEHALLRQHPLRETFGAELVELLLGARRRRLGHIYLGHARQHHGLRLEAPFHFRIAVDDDLADEREDARGTVALLFPLEELGRLVDELGGVFGAGELRVRDDLVEEAQVRRHTANAELPQRAMHARDGFHRIRGPRGDLHQHGVIRARENRARVGRACIEANAEARGTAIRGDLAVVGREAVLRIFRGHAALKRVRREMNVFLPRNAARFFANLRAVGDADLRLDEIDVGHGLGHRVFHLDARIHFDEIELAGLRVLQEFHGAGIAVFHRAADLQRVAAELGALRVREEGRGRALHHFLVAPLHRAIALEQVHEIAVRVSEDLHFDVPRLAHQLLEIDLVVAEARFGLAARDGQQLSQLRIAFDDAHAAATAAPARLEHHRVADLRRLLPWIPRCRPAAAASPASPARQPK